MTFEKLPTKIVGGKRHYVAPNGDLLPSMTTVLGTIPNPDLEAWIESVGPEVAEYVKRQAGARGTQMHTIIEEYLSVKSRGIYDEEICILNLKTKHPKLLPWALFENILPVLRNIGNIQCQEATLYSTELRVAGRVDCIGDFRLDGSEPHVPTVIDFKTATKPKEESKIQNYFLQASGYSQMYLERTGVDVPDIAIIISCESGERQVFRRNREDYIERLRYICHEYHENAKKTVS